MKYLVSLDMAVTRMLIQGGVYIHIFMFCPTDFFSVFKFINLNQIIKETRRAEHEYMHTPPPQLKF